METKKKRFLILDANTLIDYCKSDRTIIKLICTYVGQIYLANPVLTEVNEMDETICKELGIMLVEPELDEVFSAAQKRGRLSFQDHLCLLLAKKNGWTCVTNDIPLRRACEADGVPLIWSIELVCILVESNGLSAKNAKNIILEMQANNPKYITDTIVINAFARLKTSR